MDINQTIDKASRKFKFVSNSNYLKFRYLPNWVLSEATYFEKEITDTKQNQKIYKRGALVFVDFGINVGNELSGNHFAIVLNKKDSKNNGVLTVVPVSSKGNRFSVEIDGLISEKSRLFLEKNVAEMIENIVKTETSDENVILKFQRCHKEIEIIFETYSRFDKVSYAKCLDLRTISKKRIIQINQFDPVGKIYVSDETLDKIDNLIRQNFTNF